MIQDFLPIKSPLDKPELSSPEKHVVPCIIIIETCIMSIKNTLFFVLSRREHDLAKGE